MEVSWIPRVLGTIVIAMSLVLGIAALCVPSLGEDIGVPYVPGDGAGDGSGDGAGDGAGGDAGDDTGVDGGGDGGGGTGTGVDGGQSGTQLPGGVDPVPTPWAVDGDPSSVTGEDASSTSSSVPVETLPRRGSEPYNPFPSFDPSVLVVLVVVIGAVALYAPGEVQRMRIESAFRTSLDARLALARGDFAVALAGFDTAIEKAHPAYTRRTRIDRPAVWTLMPDDFYISLWRGRASALRGMGRDKAALATTRLADELEAVVGNGH